MSPSPHQKTAENTLQALRKRLLDLSGRNPLLNFRHLKGGSLRIAQWSPDNLVEKLLAETEMRMLAVPAPTPAELSAAAPPTAVGASSHAAKFAQHRPGAAQWAQYLGLLGDSAGLTADSTALSADSATPPVDSVPPAAEAPAQPDNNAIQTLLYADELEPRLRALRQRAESAIQEMGVNILYVAVGFLQWQDAGAAETRLAPLFMVPVRLRKGRANRPGGGAPYTLKYSGEDPIPNLSLREKLAADFGLELPQWDENAAAQDYLAQVQAVVAKTQPGWRVRPHMALALLNFSTLLMYLDLDPARWPPQQGVAAHPVARRLLAAASAAWAAPATAAQATKRPWRADYAVDDIAGLHARYPLADDADRAQYSAVIDAVRGKNLIIEGPPGTGKSQTITNLIAAAMASGKKVLFVAEKLAALQVVQRRLRAAGLGDFCLHLHSRKAARRQLLAEVKKRLDKRHGYPRPTGLEAAIEAYEEKKTQLRRGVERLHQPWKNTGHTPRDIFMAATRHAQTIAVDNLGELHPRGCNGERWDASAARRAAAQFERFCEIYRVVAGEKFALRQHAWHGVRNAALRRADFAPVAAALADWSQALRQLDATRPAIAAALHCQPDETPDSISGLETLLAEIKHLPEARENAWLAHLPSWRGADLQRAQQGLDLFDDIQARYATLAQQVGAKIVQDWSRVDGFLSGAEKLHRLVDENVTWGRLTAAAAGLDALRRQLAELAAPQRRLGAALDEKVAARLSLTEGGLVELSAFVELAAALPLRYWQRRHARFENPALDALLPALRKELVPLQALRKELGGVFNLDSLPSRHELLRLRKVLHDGGTFCWFSRDWRAAHRTTFGYAAGLRGKFALAKSIGRYAAARRAELLEKAADFVARRHHLLRNRRYAATLGDRMRGLDTDFAELQSLRRWYQKIHDRYGADSPMADAARNLKPELAREMHAVAEQAVLKTALAGWVELKKIFAPAAAGLKNTRLDGADGAILQLLRPLESALGACRPLAADDAMRVATLCNRAASLETLRIALREWRRVGLDKHLFHGRFALQVGLRADNAAALVVLRGTLRLAAYVGQQVTNPHLQQRLYAQPEAETFAALAALAANLEKSVQTHRDKLAGFAQLTELRLAQWQKTCGDNLHTLRRRNARAMHSNTAFANWLEYLRAREALKEQGFGGQLACIEQGEVDIKHAHEARLAGIFDGLAQEILREQPQLARFTGRAQATWREELAACDAQLKKLQREKIAWQIDHLARVPAGDETERVGDYTEQALLAHECGLTRPRTSIRQLLLRAGPALSALKPCFMMGPMSVAQYLAPGRLKFDLVVMDEASQIKPEDALGAVARGAQLVVVGDPAQLPPSNFFKRNATDEDEKDAAWEEFESILDAAQAVLPHKRRLRWHYRSQHPQLIEFSNHSFYDNDLILFPSPYPRHHADYGIKFKAVSGCFTNHQNIAEADLIAAAVRAHFMAQRAESLGVVAMNAQQRLRIEAAIDALARGDAEFQARLDNNAAAGDEQRLFIKNLENIQGDERDVLYISMTYGPKTPGGAVFRHFGPINTPGGWRRLNVLFTRAKKRMHVFSSMKSTDISVATAGRGVRALRDFLSFCESGVLPDPAANSAPASRPMAARPGPGDFEIAVARALRSHGFECQLQVGVAGFFIAAAVADPGNPQRFLLGIEGDGGSGHAASSVRDRDLHRRRILERLGWRIRRIASIDWFLDPAAALAPLVEELNALTAQNAD